MRSKHVRVLTGLFALSLLFAFTVQARGAFRLEAIGPEHEQLHLSDSKWTCYYRSDLTAAQLPQGARDVKLGEFKMGDQNPILFSVYSSREGENFDTLIFDLNGDRDFTNDEKFASFSPDWRNGTPAGVLEIQIPGGPRCKMGVGLWPDALVFETNLWLRGRLTVGDKQFDAAVVSANGENLPGSGTPVSPDAPPLRLFLDIDGNGEFGQEREDPFMKQELYYLTPGVNILGNLYDYRFDETTHDIRLIPYTGLQGKLAVKLGFASQIKTWVLDVSFSEKQSEEDRNWIHLTGTNQEFPLAVKAGNYSLEATLGLITPDGKRIELEFSKETPLSVQNGKTALLEIGKNLALEVKLIQDKNSLTAERILKDANGLVYLGPVRLIPDDSGEIDSLCETCGQVVLLDASGKQWNKGFMARWCFGHFVDSWPLTEDVKEGDTLKAILTWENPLFGKFQVEDTIVLQPFTPVRKKANKKLRPVTYSSDHFPPLDLSSRDSILSGTQAVKSDLRETRKTLEAFSVAYGHYPEKLDDPRCGDLLGITTLFIRSIQITDPFSPDHAPYHYRGEKDRYTLWSIGPDQKDDGGQVVYDPTNGLRSSGDLVMHQPYEVEDLGGLRKPSVFLGCAFVGGMFFLVFRVARSRRRTGETSAR